MRSKKKIEERYRMALYSAASFWSLWDGVSIDDPIYRLFDRNEAQALAFGWVLGFTPKEVFSSMKEVVL